MTTQIYSAYPDTSANGEKYLTVEDVALRLGLPYDLVMRRVQAGDIPSRRVEVDGVETFELRLADLGLAPDAADIVDDASLDGVVEVVGTPPFMIDNADIVENREEYFTAATAVHSSVTFDDASSINLGDVVEETIELEQLVPPPTRERQSLANLDTGPLADISGMQIDPRELVAGLLDRWERTLEQRIYAEQRQRFETELLSRQTMVRELQMELRTARAEHAAVQSEKERQLASRERALSDAEAELDKSRRAAQQAQIQLQAQAAAKKRGWLFRR